MRLLSSFVSRNLVLSRRVIKRVQSSSSAIEMATSSEEDVDQTNSVLNLVNKQIDHRETGRIFAVIHLSGRQFKVTQDDIIMLAHNRPVDVGDQIKLEKVLMIGSKDFSLIGAPLLPSSLVNIEATVIEKTLSFTEPYFFFIRRKDIRFLRLRRHELNMVRINRIELLDRLKTLSPDSL